MTEKFDPSLPLATERSEAVAKWVDAELRRSWSKNNNMGVDGTPSAAREAADWLVEEAFKLSPSEQIQLMLRARYLNDQSRRENSFYPGLDIVLGDTDGDGIGDQISSVKVNFVHHTDGGLGSTAKGVAVEQMDVYKREQK